MLKLVHNQGINRERQLFRALASVRSLLRTMNKQEVRHYYNAIEILRDGLSRLLDSADDKNA